MTDRITGRKSAKGLATQRAGRRVPEKSSSRAKGEALRIPTAPRVEIPVEWGWHFRTLLALRDHLRRERGDRLREPFETMEPPSLHAEDLFDELYDRELAQALAPIPAEALREIDDAIRRLERGTYGKCQATGRPISKARLRATPWCRYAFDAVPRPPLRRKMTSEI